MQNNTSFSNFLKDVTRQIENRNMNSCIVSICDQIPYSELLTEYSSLINKYSFSAVWEEANDFSFIALDKCKYITLDGPNRFQMAKDFHYETIKNLVNINKDCNPSSLSKIIYFFSYSDTLHGSMNSIDPPNMEAVLPKILIINHLNKSWIRMNAQLNGKNSIREILEEFWFIKNELIKKRDYDEPKNINIPISRLNNGFNKLKENLIKNISKGINLIEDGELKKIVLSTRLHFKIGNKFDINSILKKLKINQHNSCIYLWKRNAKDMTFGASPEKLFSLSNNKLTFEAIAGTTSKHVNSDTLLNDSKNLKEHQIVVDYLISCLKDLNIYDFKKSDLRVTNFGSLSHLQTFIYASVTEVCPFEMLRALHPSPAVCGLPKNIANKWIQTLEKFSRDNYAAPIGWVDVRGNADFRVAIRGSRYLNDEIQLTAGAGLVKGSKSLDEVEEIKIKLESIAKQFFLSKISQ